MKNTDNTPATPESVWEGFRKLNELLDKQSAERKEAEARFDRELEKSRAERKEAEASFNRRMKKQEELVGSWGNNHGSFAEEYFYNSFEQGKQNFFGEEFDEIEKNLKGFSGAG